MLGWQRAGRIRGEMGTGCTYEKGSETKKKTGSGTYRFKMAAKYAGYGD